MSSFSTALSGLLANTTALDVVGDNLANMNTNGFKSSSIHFQDAFSQATESLQVGGGVGATTTGRIFNQGTLRNTAGPLDAAVQGNGFFVVQDGAGQTLYTRDGSFGLNAAGQLVTGSGAVVQGWSAVNGVVTASGPVSAITVPTLGSQTPAATANMTLSANLDATAATNATFSTPIQVVDSLGKTHTLTATFTKTGANAWKYEVTIPGEEVTGGTAGTPKSIGTGTLTFDTTGKLSAPASTDAPGAITGTGGLVDGADDFNINWNFYDAAGNATVTQFAQTSAASGTTQDGVQPGTVTGVSLQNGGALVAQYSNGKQVTLAQVAIASIENPETMIAAANNNYTLSNGTVTPSIGVAGTGQRGNIVAGAVESSNVDMATEFTNLIIFQRGYQASSKVINAVNEMEQMLLALNT